jgi:hypothetical protein
MANIPADLKVQGGPRQEGNIMSRAFLNAFFRGHLLCCGDDTFVFSARYVIQCALEVFSRILETGCTFVRLKIRVDELYQAVKIFCGYLDTVRSEPCSLGVDLQRRSPGRSSTRIC